MPTAWIIEDIDESDDIKCPAAVRREAALDEHFGFEDRIAAFTHFVLLTVSNRTHRRTDASVFTKHAEEEHRILRSLVEMLNHVLTTSFALMRVVVAQSTTQRPNTLTTIAG